MLSNLASVYCSDFINLPRPNNFIHSTNASDLNHTIINVDIEQAIDINNKNMTINS